ncbi:MAG: NAD(P)/FAD-dependent oxidoreductase [Candidatus Eisenbacteria bacterium]|uniref:NAD(P)/FAD-dependent oxidoreductase n=1 Tax=Eiseniibacteriota bacterium TaxID=2212470 RepID=A0A538SZS7_UNCEI|nr:MAG: NAD(P)/FAD-dependent oxidoreductase [Candidatus Eisenbacteria bacterium]
MERKRLLILGGGFVGLDVARSIGKSPAARKYWDTVLIDKENFFQFNPLLPAVAVGAVETRHIVYPLRDMARHRQIRFVKNKATHIDLARREVLLHNDLVMPYDTLVIAVGSVTNYYDVPGAQEHARPFKTIVDAMYVRARVVELFEMAEQAETADQRRELLSFVIVGGGVTGVEVAAELMDMARDTLLPKYPSLSRSDLSVTIIEGGDRIIPAARPEHSAYVYRFLVRRGVRLFLGRPAVRVEPKCVHLPDGTKVEAFTILWTAGVRPPDLVTNLPVLHIKDGRVRVDDYLRALDPEGEPIEDVFVAGDCAASLRPDGTYQPALSQTGVAMGTYLGGLLVNRARGKPAKPFRFKPAGYIISLGKHSSVLELFGVPLSGKLAWLLWAAAYLIKMVGFRKQLEVGIDHLTHLIFEHDSSQILNRRQILSDEELNLSLGR